MTRPVLVLDGNTIKLRLQAERVASKTPVHVDWVRFTVLRRHCATADVSRLFPLVDDLDTWERVCEFERELKRLPDCDTDAAMQAQDLAKEVADALGSDFTVAREPRKGHDFYRFRWSVERNGVEVGWVGFQASSDSPRQQAQARTLHCNLFGAACTFAATGWNRRIADIVDARNGDLTRADLALDFFDGFSGGIERIRADYDAGQMNVCGKLPKCNYLGDWSDHSKGGRSFYWGSKQAGKQSNAYEKGDQLFGVGTGSKWLRIELRYGNKLRELPTDMLRDPASFFAGASDWHAAILREADAIPVMPVPVKAKPRLALQTVEAEATRMFRWACNVAGPSIATLFHAGGDELLLSVLGTTKRPGRLGRFSLDEIREALARINPISTAEGIGPAFA